MRFGSLVIGQTAASLALALAVGTGCSLLNAPDDVKAGAGGADTTVSGAGGDTTTSTTSTTATTSTTTSSTTTTTGSTTGAGGGGGAGGGPFMCPAGTADCDGDPGNGCEKLDTPDHCGDCNTTCSAATMNVATPLCTAGACDYDACAAGFADCDGDRKNGCELPVSADVSNCGACMNVCSPLHVDTAACSGGKCGYGACQQGFGDCDGNPANGCEADLSSDQANCGFCGKSCGNASCQQGSCVIAPLFDSLTGAVSLTSRQAGDSCGTLISVAGNVSISRIAVRNNMNTNGNLKFLIFDHATKQLLFVSSPMSIASGDSWKLSAPFGFVLAAGKSYDIGAISDVAGTWSFDQTAETVGVISSKVQNPNFSNYAAPSVVGSGGADCGIRLYP